jgi:hypothetical protein
VVAPPWAIDEVPFREITYQRIGLADIPRQIPTAHGGGATTGLVLEGVLNHDAYRPVLSVDVVNH